MVLVAMLTTACAILSGADCCPLYQLQIVAVTHSSKTKERNSVFLFDTIDKLFGLHVRRFTDYSLTCSKIFCEYFDAVTYSVHH